MFYMIELLNKEALTTQEAEDGLNKAIEAATAVVDNLTPETYKEHIKSS